MFRQKKFYIILAIILSIGGLVYYAKAKKPLPNYTTQAAERGNLTRTVSVTGEIIAPSLASLSFKFGGQIESMMVKVGDHVEAGDVIASIDKGTLTAQLAQAQYEVDAQKRTLADMKRREEIYSSFQKDAQRERIKKAEEAASEIMKHINDTTLRSPITGTVIKKNFEIGELVTAASAIVTIATDGDLQVEAQVPESDIIEVRVGQSAAVTLDALPTEEILEAVVTEIEPASTVIQDVVYFKVRLNLAGQDDRLKVGMSADIDISTMEKQGVVIVPMRSVKKDGGESYVEILGADNSLQKIGVATGISGDDGLVEISAGLSGGENVVILTSEK